MNRLYFLFVGVLLILTVITVVAHPPIPDQSDYPIYLPLISRSPIAPEIISFRADPESAAPNQTVTLSWESVRADQVEIRRIDYRPVEWWTDLPMSGTQIYTVPDQMREPMYFEIEATNSVGGEWLSAETRLTVGIICPYPWFFTPTPEGCPTAPRVFSAVEQPFENGYMVWLEDGDRVAVLFGEIPSGDLSWFDNNWDGGSICDLGDPPSGYFHPQGILGHLWCENEMVREGLGWGVALEVDYETIRQDVTIRRGFMIYHTHTYIRAADGNVWVFHPPVYGGWQKIIVDD